MKLQRVIGCCAMLIALATQGAQAQSNKEMVVESADGWRYHPATTNGQVIGFLVERVIPSQGANEFDVVWIPKVDDEYAVIKGWSDTTALDAAFDVLSWLPTASFNHSELGRPIQAATSECGTLTPGGGGGVVVENGLAVNDPLQPLAAYLTPEFMQSVIENGAAGAIGVSEKEIDLVASSTGEFISTTTKNLSALE